MSFENVARQIVEEAIASAISIDDEFCEPYREPEDCLPVNYQRSKSLFESFRRANCLLDIYRYRNVDDWRENSSRLLNNKDLLILDWQLNGDKHEETLEILKKAVETESLPFVYIYTNIEDLKSILYEIRAYFSAASPDKLKEKYKELTEKLDDMGIFPFADEFLETDELKRLTRELVVEPEKANTILEDIKAYVKNASLSESITDPYQTFCRCVAGSFKTKLQEALEFLGFMLNNAFLNENAQGTLNPIRVEDDTYILNHTLIKIAQKDDIQAVELYSNLTDAVCKRPHSFLTLLGLEMRNSYRKSSSMIGKSINAIDEHAFFHHQISLNDDIRFFDFLKDIWRDQVSAFIHFQKPHIFQVLHEYKAKRQIANSLIEFYDSGDYETHLARLNHYYSVLQINREHQSGIRFGDVFSMSKLVKGKLQGGSTAYVMCITPHCDCLYPEENINHNFLFVKGTRISLGEGLNIGDEGFISFIEVDSSKPLICIRWKPRPFSIYIPTASNNIHEIIPCRYMDTEIVLKHIACLKENYVQRITNRAMSHAVRVGVDYAKLKIAVTKCTATNTKGKRCGNKTKHPSRRCYAHR